ncbi:hypothetical protein TZ00_08760 [Agreia bicolorata]|uniref:N-acetyltransferase domain-containing protein n=1 Tax=Agreia bicolorata TaxID=110935 RepID=A0ABR5CFW0_9MICO|nr:hypothetical protein TZ00_08760 [Agreia bicolorata]
MLGLGLEVFEHDPFESELALIIDSAIVEAEYRGRGSGRLVVEELMRKLGRGRLCTTVLLRHTLDWVELDSASLRRAQRRLLGSGSRSGSRSSEPGRA